MTDYIDREKIGLTDFELVMCGNDYKEVCKMLLNKIASIPAADVQPVKRGKWLDLWIEDDELIGGGYNVPQCSVCKEDSYGTTPFCSFCGADMRGVE